MHACTYNTLAIRSVVHGFCADSSTLAAEADAIKAIKVHIPDRQRYSLQSGRRLVPFSAGQDQGHDVIRKEQDTGQGQRQEVVDLVITVRKQNAFNKN